MKILEQASGRACARSTRRRPSRASEFARRTRKKASRRRSRSSLRPARPRSPAPRRAYKAARGELKAKFDAEKQKVEQEYAEVRQRAAKKAASAKKAAKRENEEVRWQILAVFESGKDSSVKQFKKAEAELAASLADLQTIHDEADYVLVRCRRFAPPAVEPTETPAPEVEDTFAAIQERLTLAGEQLPPLAKLRLPKFLAPQNFVWPFIFLGLRRPASAAGPLLRRMDRGGDSRRPSLRSAAGVGCGSG